MNTQINLTELQESILENWSIESKEYRLIEHKTYTTIFFEPINVEEFDSIHGSHYKNVIERWLNKNF